MPEINRFLKRGVDAERRMEGILHTKGAEEVNAAGLPVESGDTVEVRLDPRNPEFIILVKEGKFIGLDRYADIFSIVYNRDLPKESEE